MAVKLSNDIPIACRPETIFAYVTQPWLWHEWHPNSQSAWAKNQNLAVGDTFEEVIEVQPLPLLPWRMRRQTRYQVLVSESPVAWVVRGQMGDGWLEIHYQLQPDGEGTLFHRELQFDVSGPSRLLLPLLKRRMATMSRLALDNLKRQLEQQLPERKLANV